MAVQWFDRALPITPSDSTDHTFSCKNLYVGGAGSLKVTTFGGDTQTFANVTAGTLLPLHVKRVWSTGTTATNIVGLS
jgi:hypothetical protein